MTPARKPAAVSIHQLKVTLKGSKPPIWRRIQVRSDISLHKLHQILQVAMGWTDSHLHQFIVDETHYGEPDPDYWIELKSERRAKLSQVAPYPGSRFIYEYDFGDGWEHGILVEKVLPAEEGVRYPRCLKGRRACPPEDCGGIWGYADLLDIIRDPNHEEYESMWQWLGGSFDPAAFDLDGVNLELASII